MKKTIVTTLALAMTLNSVAFAQGEKKMNQKEVDRVLKVAAMTNEERQAYRLTVLDEVASYKQGLEVLKGQLKRANDFRDDAAYKAQLATLGALVTGGIKYFSFHRVKTVKSKSQVVVEALTTLSVIASGSYGLVKGGHAVKATVTMNELETKIDKAIEEINLLGVELQAISDLSPKE